MSPDRDCVLECGPDKTCYVDTCCARTTSTAAATDAASHGTEPSLLRQRASNARCLTPDHPGQPACSALDSMAAPASTLADNLATIAPSWSAPVIDTLDTRA